MRAAILLFALLVHAAPLHAQTTQLRPLVLIDDSPAFGARLTARTDRQAVQSHRDFPRSWQLAAFLDLPVYTSAARNPGSLRARVGGGLDISLFRPSRPPPGQPPSPDDPAPLNYGWVSLLLEAGAEAAQTLDDADLTIGAALAYGHDQPVSLWFLPSARLAYDRVLCVGCAPDAAPDAAPGAADETGSRLDAELGWDLPADRRWVPRTLRPLWLRLDGRAFAASGLREVEARNEEGLWGSVELAWRFDADGLLHEVYLRGHGGRLPQRLRQGRALTAGVTLSF